MMRDPERDLHVEEVKVRFKPDDAELLRLIAKRKDMPLAVLVRTIVVRSLESGERSMAFSVPLAHEKRSPA